jgi:hypothetical protein
MCERFTTVSLWDFLEPGIAYFRPEFDAEHQLKIFVIPARG